MKRDAVKKAILDLKPAGGTQMYTGMERALEGMKDVSGRRLLMVLTDGIDDNRKAEQRDKIIARAKELRIPLYMVGLGEGKDIDEKSMKEFAEKSEGQYLRTPRPEELKKIYVDIGKSLQNEYVLEYDSPYPVEDGRPRDVRVTVRFGDSGTTAAGGYKVSGILGTGVRKAPAAGTTGTDGTTATPEKPPFAGVFFPLLAVLGLLFAIPYALQLRGGKAEAPPAVAPAAMPMPAPPRPAVPPPSPIVQAPTRPMQAGGDVCPHCKQYRAPGAPGQRFCMVCERTY
jgi:hypothetical protein